MSVGVYYMYIKETMLKDNVCIVSDLTQTHIQTVSLNDLQVANAFSFLVFKYFPKSEDVQYIVVFRRTRCRLNNPN